MKPTEKHIEAAARAICIAQGYDPKTLDHVGSYSGLPLWKDKMGSAEAALSAALAVEAGAVDMQGIGATHPDALAVDRFADAMKAKMAKKRAEGRGGWQNRDECSGDFLSQLLRDHVEKGDPVDVGNLAMMLHQRGERITTSPASSGVEGEKCPICAEVFKPTDLCASDIEMGTCHAACLEGSPVVDLDTGKPSDGPISTYRFDEGSRPASTPAGDGWRPIGDLDATNERLIIIGSYNARRQWCADIWSTQYLRDQQAKSADGFYMNAPHLKWVPTHFMELPAAPAPQTEGSANG
ncbi:hypothetical protein SAMN05892877_111233 [Rhizobium subbaraonis]|uniref:Uncharacterized protein n=1 Tax=Rhizobium subbaraonis TaxID=908946 RepID=A0A285UPG6_9HYPH|nr:hypothetical protein [Rhizobium subbaraonis]SOC43795.1 hypothetical protein SAMN05892877_111233 [Rhizobium subbaraonis]